MKVRMDSIVILSLAVCAHKRIAPLRALDTISLGSETNNAQQSQFYVPSSKNLRVIDMDVLPDVLHTVRLQSVIYCHSELTAPWGLHVEGAAGTPAFLW
jgi:Cupin